MSDKMECPGCGSYTSGTLRRFNDGQSCDHCGLSASAAMEILAVREKQADADLKAKLEEALKRADKAEDQARRLRNQLTALLRKAKEVSVKMEDPEPWLKDW